MQHTALPQPTRCQHCGHIAAVTVCTICKRDKLPQQPSAVSRQPLATIPLLPSSSAPPGAHYQGKSAARGGGSDLREVYDLARLGDVGITYDQALRDPVISTSLKRIGAALISCAALAGCAAAPKTVDAAATWKATVVWHQVAEPNSACREFLGETGRSRNVAAGCHGWSNGEFHMITGIIRHESQLCTAGHELGHGPLGLFHDRGGNWVIHIRETRQRLVEDLKAPRIR